LRVPDFVEFAAAVAVVLAVVAAVAVVRCWSSKVPGVAYLAAYLRGGTGMLQGAGVRRLKSVLETKIGKRMETSP
jgi:hypothetical protein